MDGWMGRHPYPNPIHVLTEYNRNVVQGSFVEWARSGLWIVLAPGLEASTVDYVSILLGFKTFRYLV